MTIIRPDPQDFFLMSLTEQGVREKTRQRLGKEDMLRKGKVSKDQ
jgi:hypothetical protein